MEKNKWTIYSDLAWTESILCSPEAHLEETTLFSKVIKDHSRIEARTLLHLGCGAGINDYTFKRHFVITGVGISEDMLKIARNLNPEVNYRYRDMRTIRLTECYDAIVIPDSIGYITTIKELRNTI